MPVIGYLGAPAEPAQGSQVREAFVRGLREFGLVPGKNVALEARRWETPDELRKAAREILQRKVDVIYIHPPGPASVLLEITRSVPIVCSSCGDPVDNGLVASLARPGGNLTGLASLSAELIGKRLELLKEMLPRTNRVSVFVFPANPGTPNTLRALEQMGRAMGIELQRVEIRSPEDFEGAFRSAAQFGAQAVFLQDDPMTRVAGPQIARLGLAHKVPVASGIPDVAEAGALVAYGPDRLELARRAAGFVDKILKGAKPADLPIEQAAKLDLVLNLKTARALGIAIPRPFLARTERTIE